jgi:hypothetical protein
MDSKREVSSSLLQILSPVIDMDVVYRLLLIVNLNSHCCNPPRSTSGSSNISSLTPTSTTTNGVDEHDDDDTELTHLGLYSMASKVTHSCQPNLRISFKGNRLRFNALEGIANDVLLTVSYLSPLTLLSDTMIRRHHLWHQKLFFCECRRCQLPFDNMRTIKCLTCDSLRRGMIDHVTMRPWIITSRSVSSTTLLSDKQSLVIPLPVRPPSPIDDDDDTDEENDNNDGKKCTAAGSSKLVVQRSQVTLVRHDEGKEVDLPLFASSPSLPLIQFESCLKCASNDSDKATVMMINEEKALCDEWRNLHLSSSIQPTMSSTSASTSSSTSSPLHELYRRIDSCPWLSDHHWLRLHRLLSDTRNDVTMMTTSELSLYNQTITWLNDVPQLHGVALHYQHRLKQASQGP